MKKIKLNALEKNALSIRNMQDAKGGLGRCRPCVCIARTDYSSVGMNLSAPPKLM